MDPMRWFYHQLQPVILLKRATQFPLSLVAVSNAVLTVQHDGYSKITAVEPTVYYIWIMCQGMPLDSTLATVLIQIHWMRNPNSLM